MNNLPFTISGRVSSGKKIAGSLGYPTANLSFNVPPSIEHGVYLGRCSRETENIDFPSIIFYGIPYTLQETLSPRFEVHILNQKDLNLYQSILTVQCEQYVRANKKFASREDLISAIKNDIAYAQDYFSLKK